MMNFISKYLLGGDGVPECACAALKQSPSVLSMCSYYVALMMNLNSKYLFVGDWVPACACAASKQPPSSPQLVLMLCGIDDEPQLKIPYCG